MLHILPITIAIIVLGVVEATMASSDAQSQSTLIPNLPSPPNFSACTAAPSLTNPFGPVPCYVGQFFYCFVFLFLIIVAGLFLFFNVITFNVPGAPPVVRALVPTIIGLATIYAIYGMVRGGGTRS